MERAVCVKTASVPLLIALCSKKWVKSCCNGLQTGCFLSRAEEHRKASRAVLEGSGYAF